MYSVLHTLLPSFVMTSFLHCHGLRHLVQLCDSGPRVCFGLTFHSDISGAHSWVLSLGFSQLSSGWLKCVLLQLSQVGLLITMLPDFLQLKKKYALYLKDTPFFSHLYLLGAAPLSSGD